MNCEKCQHAMNNHIPFADVAPAETAAEKIQLVGLACVDCEICFEQRPDMRCSECGAADPKVLWVRVEHTKRSFVPVSNCCEAQIVNRDGCELTGDDLGAEL